MPTLLTEANYPAVPLDPPRKRWTRAECRELQSSGVLAGQRLELVEGELVNRMGKNRPHVIVVGLVVAWLIEVFGKEYVHQEAPIDVAPEDNPTSEPEPDAIVLTRPSRTFSTNPKPLDLRLIAEISDTTLGFDLNQKSKLYARAGVGDYWVFDLAARRLIVNRDPRNGKYQSMQSYSSSESVAPLAAPVSPFAVGQVFST